jgi:small subunit ribosomal protein S1
VSFGAFAKLENGIEGLIHLSEMSLEKVQRPEDILHVGQKVMAKIISISPVERKVGLSIREYQKDLEGEIMQTHGSGSEAIDVGSLLRDVFPLDLLQQGETIEKVAEKLMHNGEEILQNSFQKKINQQN